MLYDSKDWQQEMEELFQDVEQFLNGEQEQDNEGSCPDCGRSNGICNSGTHPGKRYCGWCGNHW